MGIRIGIRRGWKRPLAIAMLAACCAGGIARAAEEDGGRDDANEETVRMDAAEASRILAQKLPQGASQKAEVDFLITRQQAAFAAGDGAARLAALTRLVELTSDNGAPSRYLGYLWNEEWRHGNQTRALEIGEKLVRDRSLTLAYRALNAAEVGSCYLELGNFDKAQSMLNQAEDMRREAESTQKLSDALFIADEVERLRSGILLTRGDVAGAEASARKAVDISHEEVKRAAGLKPGDQKNLMTDRSLRERDAVMFQLMTVFIAQGKNDEAESLARLGLRNAQLEKTGGSTTGNWLRKLAQAKLGQRRYADALDYARQAVSVFQANGVGASSSRMVSAQIYQLQALFGLEKWADADQVLSAIKAATTDDTAAQLRIDSPILRSVLHLYNGRADLAFQTVDGSVRYRSRNYGDNSPSAVEAKAVRAMVYQERQSNGQALSDYEAVFKSIFSQETSFADAEPAGLRGFYTPLALRSYLRLIQTIYKEDGNKLSEDDLINDSFRVADRLRTSVVQRALIDSAARVVATTPELAALIRREQDQRRERNDQIAHLTQLLDEDQKLNLEQKEREKDKEKYSYADAQMDKQKARLRRDGIDKSRKRILDLEQQRGQSIVDIGKSFPRYQALVNPKPPTLDQLGKKLKAGEALISIYPTSTGSFVWGVNAAGTKAFHLSPLTAADVRLLTAKIRKTLDVGSRADPSKVAFDYDSSYKLYAELAGPVLAQLPGTTSLSFAVNGDLAQIPLSVLLTRKSSGGADALADAGWLLKDMAVNQISTASSFYALRDNNRKSASRPFIGFGDPLFQSGAAQTSAQAAKKDLRTLFVKPAQGNSRAASSANTGAGSFDDIDYASVPALPETRNEILAVAKQLGASATDDVYFGRDASRDKVLSSDLSDRRVIAFATHGLKPGDFAGLSRPALAMAATGSPAKSPLLTLDDILTLKLNADWVILSACNTASDDGRAEEAMSGLARGFFFAGSRSVLVTQWAVESMSAEELVARTTGFYAKNADAGRSQSLRQAQLELIAGKADPRFRHPFFWSAYVTSGDPAR